MGESRRILVRAAIVTRWWRALAVAGAVAVLLAVSAPAGHPPIARAATTQVNIRDFFFDPQAITVRAGDTVTWTNSGAVTHTTTADSGQADTWNSGFLAPAAFFSHTFNTAGTFTYHCNVHPFMTGSVTVSPVVGGLAEPVGAGGAPARTVGSGGGSRAVYLAAGLAAALLLAAGAFGLWRFRPR